MASISKQNALVGRTTIACGHFPPISLPFRRPESIFAGFEPYCKSARTKSAHLSPIMMLGALVLPDIKRGMMLASAI